MIERKLASILLNEAKNTGDALASARLFNEIQKNTCRLQPIDEILNILLVGGLQPSRQLRKEPFQESIPLFYRQ